MSALCFDATCRLEKSGDTSPQSKEVAAVQKQKAPSGLAGRGMHSKLN
jgi:hypothetical protein